MTALLSSDVSLLVRTDFTDDSAWEETRAASLAENADGFQGWLRIIDDANLADATWQELRHSILTQGHHTAVLFIADRAALTGEHPIRVVDLTSESSLPFRCLASLLFVVDSNVNACNESWDDFVTYADPDGVYRLL